MTQRLKATQVYPAAFGHAVRSLHMKWKEPCWAFRRPPQKIRIRCPQLANKSCLIPNSHSSSKETDGNVEALRENLYPPHSRFNEELVSRATKAGLLGAGQACKPALSATRKQLARILNFDRSVNCLFVWEAPYRWRHACLTELQEFLSSEKKAGRYHPVISGGLD